MATSPPQNPSSGDPSEVHSLAAAALAAPASIWRSLVARLPPLPDSGLLAAVSDLHRRHFGVRRRRRRGRPSLPLPLRPAAAHSVRIAGEMPKAFVILDDVVQHTLSNLHSIHKSLLFWQSKAEGTNSQKVYFMIFERGPRAFVEVTYQTFSRLGHDGRPVQYILHSASDMVSTKLAALTSMQHCLAAFLAEVHSEVDKCREGLTESSDKSLRTLFVVLNTTFSKLEVSLRTACEVQDELFTHDGKSNEPLFEKLPEADVESSQWTDALSTDGISLIYQNLQKLDDFLSSQLSSHKKPKNLTIYWLPYTCGALGLSVCSLWLLRHSSLMGSPDIDNWIQDAKVFVAGFWNEHVETPIISIRDELFETFKQRDKGVMEKQEVQLTEDSLRRMLIAFCEQTSGGKLPEDESVQAMLEILTKRYEKELIHPIQNLFSGELARAMLIQIQKLKLDLESGLLEMDQILRANAINFAVLAALPAFGLSVLLLALVRTWVMRDHGAEGRGNVARCQRRLLLVDVERRLMEFQYYLDKGMEEEARCKFGLVLYTLDRLYKAVESHAKETGEWLSLREDIFDLAKLDMGTPDKLIVVSRLKWMYSCLLPFSSSRLPRL